MGELKGMQSCFDDLFPKSFTWTDFRNGMKASREATHACSCLGAYPRHVEKRLHDAPGFFAHGCHYAHKGKDYGLE